MPRPDGATRNAGHDDPAVFGMHRALRRLPRPTRRAWSWVALPLAANAALVLGHDSVVAFWTRALQACVGFAGLPAGVVEAVVDVGGRSVRTPTLDLPGSAPSLAQWLVAAALVAAAALGSLRLPERLLPLAYFLRLVAIVVGVTLFQFAVAPGSFPRSLAGHLQAHLLCSLALIACVPWLFALSYSVFDPAPGHEIALVATASAFLLVAAPVQAAAHAVVVHVGSLVWLPLLFLLFGLLPLLAALVALYGWALSWGDPGPRTR